MNEEITLPLWFPLGLLIAIAILAVVAFSAAEGAVHMSGRVQELRWLLGRKDAQIRRLRDREYTRLVAHRPPPAPVAEWVPWPDPDPGDLVAVDHGMHLGPAVWGTWPELPPAEPTQPVVIALPLTDRFEIAGAPS